MKYFGTDGIRGIVGKTLTPALIRKLARSLVKYYNKHKLINSIIIGNDSRSSSCYIIALIKGILLKHGINVDTVGVCSSPCIAYLTRKLHYPLGIMISASHNPYEYNGIKFFNSDGEKISDKTELELEYAMEKRLKLPVKYAISTDKSDLKEYYINYLKLLKNCDIPCIFDCANGGASKIVKLVFPNTRVINDKPNGENINNNAGCLHPELLKSVCVQNGVIGFALDGDGDRLNIVTKTGKIIKGDEILFILAKQLLSKNDNIIGTIYTNQGLNDSLKSYKINLFRAGVGDKLVYDMMHTKSSVLGGENSGHIIVKQFTNTGDGLLTAILILNILAINKCDIEDLLADYHSYFQAETSIPLTKDFKLDENLKLLIYNYEQNGARVIIRPSGTEPVIRLFVEHENEQLTNKFLKSIKDCINNKCK